MRIIKSHQFWIGVVAGVIVGPMVLNKVAPGMKAKIPGSS